MRTFEKAILITLSGVLVLLAVFYLVFTRPFLQADTQMSREGGLALYQQTDGTLLLTWPDTPEADRYLVQITDRETKASVFAAYCESESCALPDLPTGRTLVVRVNSVKDYWHPWKQQFRLGSAPLAAAVRLEVAEEAGERLEASQPAASAPVSDESAEPAAGSDTGRTVYIMTLDLTPEELAETETEPPEEIPIIPAQPEPEPEPQPEPEPEPEEPPAQTQVSFQPTGSSGALYATVWPIQDLTVYDTSARGTAIGTASAMGACCVAGEENGMFYVRVGAGWGWIDSNYCLINLPDYLGNLCSYDIVNSYSAIYMAHDVALPTITGTVITGYEYVQTTTGYLVPLIYPAAKKLEQAGLRAMEDGYQLKIYDAYRPGKATRMLYDTTFAMQSDIIPATGETYGQRITGGVYSLSDFLARNGSTHNQGAALDLTLVDAQTGQELQMQTALHDLSWYAIRAYNNDAANLLSGYMTGAGFGTLSTEWWHYQDNDNRNALGLPYQYEGVTLAGWHYDGQGWKYLRADGSYLTGQQVLDGVGFYFDALGYVTE